MKSISILLTSLFFIAACEPASGPPGDEAARGAGEAATTPTEPPIESAGGPVAGFVRPSPVDDAARLAAIAAAVEHEERPLTDRDMDTQRKPLEVLAFSGIGPGMSVLELFAGGGYYTELLSRLVGPEGEVWAHNPPQFYQRFGSADFDERLAGHRLSNVVRHDLPLDDLALPDGRFDATVAAMVFHDFYWLTDDVPAVLAAVHRAMKPGGLFLVTDHAAPGGTGAAYALGEDGKHRIEEAYLVQQMDAAGFELVDTSDALRQPEDDRTQPFFAPGMRGRFTDRFVLLFRRR